MTDDGAATLQWQPQQKTLHHLVHGPMSPNLFDQSRARRQGDSGAVLIHETHSKPHRWVVP